MGTDKLTIFVRGACVVHMLTKHKKKKAEVGVLNRNIAGSARLVSYGTDPPGYIQYRLGLCSLAGRYEVS
jgi:hypothetical protein